MSETNGTSDLPPDAVVIGLTPGEMRTETCYMCDNPVAVSVAVAAEMASKAKRVNYVHAYCHFTYMKRLMELHGVRPQ